MKYINSLSFVNIFGRYGALCLLMGLMACKTSGNLRNTPQTTREAAPTEEIKTVSNPVIQAPNSDELERELALTRGRLDEVETLRAQEKEVYETKIAELEKLNAELIAQRAAAPSAKSSFEQNAPSKKDGFKLLWDQAIAQSRKNNFKAAEALFNEIIKQYPTKDGTSWAIIGLAFSKYSLEDFKGAALNFNEILDKYPKHKRRSLASFGLGVSFAMMKQNKDAKLFFEDAISIAPRSAHGQLAKDILAKKKKLPTNLFATFPAWYK